MVHYLFIYLLWQSIILFFHLHVYFNLFLSLQFLLCKSIFHFAGLVSFWEWFYSLMGSACIRNLCSVNITVQLLVGYNIGQVLCQMMYSTNGKDTDNDYEITVGFSGAGFWFGNLQAFLCINFFKLFLDEFLLILHCPISLDKPYNFLESFFSLLFKHSIFCALSWGWCFTAFGYTAEWTYFIASSSLWECSLTGTGAINAPIICVEVLLKRWRRNVFLNYVYLKPLYNVSSS